MSEAPVHEAYRMAQEGALIIDGTELSDDVRNIAEVRRETGM